MPDPTPRPAPDASGRSGVWAGAALAATWLAYFGVLQWSVVRFRVGIVLTLTAACLALAWWLVTRATVRTTRAAVAVALTGSALLTMTVPLFSYLPAGWELTARGVLAAAAVAAALWLGRPAAAWAAALGGYAVSAAIAIVTDPAPRIDVWVTLQQAADALGAGENFYAVTWVDSPGVQDAFTYLPWTAVLLAPGRWLAGDVRWMQLIWVLVLALAIHRLGVTARVDARWEAAAVGAMILLAPGTLTQIDQAWTEPLLLTGIAWWALLVARGRAWLAVLPLALACASKQHLALMLPLLLLWRPFGARRAIATGALTGIAIAPWFVTAPRDFVRDTVTLLLDFHPIRFANTWYLYFLNEHGITLPFWITGCVVLGTLAAAMVMVARRQPPLGELLRWVALVLLAANLVNKQAFYNQYWLAGTLVALSLLADAVGSADRIPAARRPSAARGPGERACSSPESPRSIRRPIASPPPSRPNRMRNPRG